jgi:hypothetical protein
MVRMLEVYFAILQTVSLRNMRFEKCCGVPKPNAENMWLEALHPPNKVVPAFHDSRRSLTKEQGMLHCLTLLNLKQHSCQCLGTSCYVPVQRRT